MIFEDYFDNFLDDEASVDNNGCVGLITWNDIRHCSYLKLPHHNGSKAQSLFYKLGYTVENINANVTALHYLTWAAVETIEYEDMKI